EILFRRTVDALIAEERAKRHNAFADKLSLAAARKSQILDRRHASSRTDELAFETLPRRTLASLYLDATVRDAITELIEEHLRVDLLRSHGLEPRNRILLTGAPGNGKTSLAESIAEALSVPLYLVRYEGIIANLLGDTARRINTLLERLATEHCVLFFDEFDAIAKFRGDENETGEIKRLVTALLGHLDRLAPHVIVVAATNHPELLDRAIWRRFDLHVELAAPDEDRLMLWLADFYAAYPEPPCISMEALADALRGKSYSELESFRNLVRRRYVLALPEASLRRVIARTLRGLKQHRKLTGSRGGTTFIDDAGAAKRATSDKTQSPDSTGDSKR
ncbi:MAG TPA: ATP-binding protein, partial [Pyrinomonadaceae bacterium]